MMIRTLTAAICTFGLLFALSGCGSSCTTACSKIYDECEFSFDGTSESQCVDECENSYADDEAKDEAIDCVMKASCDVGAINTCLM